MGKLKIWILLSIGLLFGFPNCLFSKELRIYNWTDYIDPSLIKEFTKETGIKVIYDTFDSNDVLLAKTLTGNSGYDLIVPSDFTVKYLIQADKLLKIDQKKLPNYKNIWSFVQIRLAEIELVNEYSVPYMWGTTGIAYNVDKVEELIPEAPVDTMALLFNPEYAEKLASCGIYLIDSPSEYYPMSLMYLGYPANSTDDKYLEEANQLIREIRPYVKKFHSSEYINALANGDACIVLGWSGDIYLAKARAKEAGSNININYMIPKEGALLWFDQFAILKDAKNIDEAYQFINFMLDAKINARAADFVEYATSNKAAFEFTREELRKDLNLYPPESVLDRLSVKLPYTQRDQKKLMKMWMKIKNQ